MLRRNLYILLAAALVLSIAGYSLHTLTAPKRAAVRTVSNVTAVTPVIDPGHGGFDPGTTSSSGTLEKDINLAIALKTELFMRFLGLRPILTRDTDISVDRTKMSDIQGRTKLLNSTENGVLLSIHQNYFEQSSPKGAQVFYHGAANKPFADIMQESLRQHLDPSNTRQSKPASGVYLLKHAQKPAVLVECGFLSNPADEALLKSENFQVKTAMAITKGFLDWSATTNET